MTEENKQLDITTKLVHAGERLPLPSGQAVSTPIYATSTFTYDTMEEVDRVFAGEQPGYVYTRHGNPTLAALEQAMLVVEEGATACVYASGMAALHAALIASDLKAGSTVLASQDIYGATTNLLFTVFGSFGVKTVTADFSNVDALRDKVREVRPQVILAETISNPLLKICDIEGCAEIARENNARLIIDNTFASPYLCQPLKLGADMVVHSATKYLGGHADAMGGIVVSRDEFDSNGLISAMKLVGGVLGVWEAHTILRGTKTLALRMERQCDNARRLAEHLIGNSRLARVYYPTLPTTDGGVDVTSRILRTPYGGALVSIELKEQTREAAFRFMDAVKLCVRSTSLGDVFTSVMHAASASHRDLTPARRAELGIGEGLVRISVGIENIDDIVADIEQALAT
ncbi:MAG TPA: PLP-dependent aspartate aminotransferase family protein [Pyrinomonadaceae bacterium]|nr:PLP-dependent aspartate aminotransferase family protein [Pyrinomonadaceae bacterium]